MRCLAHIRGHSARNGAEWERFKHDLFSLLHFIWPFEVWAPQERGDQHVPSGLLPLLSNLSAFSDTHNIPVSYRTRDQGGDYPIVNYWPYQDDCCNGERVGEQHADRQHEQQSHPPHRRQYQQMVLGP